MKSKLINTQIASLRRKLLSVFGVITSAAVIGLCCALPQQASAQSANATTMFNGYNSAFLYTSGSTAVYKNSFSDSGWQSSWGLAFDIYVAEDVCEINGSAANKTLVNNLCASFLVNNWTNGWAGDGWNDDIGWMSICMARGYQLTGNQLFLNAAEYGFNMAFSRGWDGTSNGGGILELQGSTGKNPLSNDSLGKAAIIIYQCTGDGYYRDRAVQIYTWVWHNLFNPSTGDVYGYINPDGTAGTGIGNAYNEGTFADFANLLYESGQGASYLGDAKMAINYAINYAVSFGIFSDGGTSAYADEISRAIGHVCRYTPSLWNNYYPFMASQVNAIWSHRRTDYNLTWNAWDQQTPINSAQIPNSFVGAVSMMLFTPATNPGGGAIIPGTHTIVNQANGLAIDNGSSYSQGAGVLQWTVNGGNAQKWRFTQNSDNSWNIVSQYSNQNLDDGASSANGAQMVQWGPTGSSNQKWWVDVQSNGHYKIWNQANSESLDDDSKSANGTPLIQWTWSGGANQLWILQ